MDYVIHASLPSLRLSELGHFRARAGRPVIPLPLQRKTLVRMLARGATKRRAFGLARTRIVAAL